jgi:hypothetical protein
VAGGSIFALEIASDLTMLGAKSVALAQRVLSQNFPAIFLLAVFCDMLVEKASGRIPS